MDYSPRNALLGRHGQLLPCIGFPSWSFDDWAQFELDTLEDIFKRSDWQERALKPALSSILAPALCAVYASYEDDKSISNLEDDRIIWDRHYTLKDLSSIEVKIHGADSPTSSSDSFFLPITDDRERPRSPELLYPPIANIAEIKEKLPRRVTPEDLRQSSCLDTKPSDNETTSSSLDEKWRLNWPREELNTLNED
ncbi:hypothetical protein OS493_006381 [Desmophyllum pertusum]|uniref:Uncharacterized protein n=1 Tax=Desmophyllum pertusum TaxID=174260 RepID=A0A9X0A4P6_9CNID|nr:hypothetical protein OS493_006381 [Desmophyllum pertusum]